MRGFLIAVIVAVCSIIALLLPKGGIKIPEVKIPKSVGHKPFQTTTSPEFRKLTTPDRSTGRNLTKIPLYELEKKKDVITILKDTKNIAKRHGDTEEGKEEVKKRIKYILK